MIMLAYGLVVLTQMKEGREFTDFGWGIYHGLNIVGAVLIGASMLIGPMNVGSFVLQILFALTGLVGMVYRLGRVLK